MSALNERTERHRDTLSMVPALTSAPTRPKMVSGELALHGGEMSSQLPRSSSGQTRTCLAELRASLRSVQLNADVLAGVTDGVPRSCVAALARHTATAGTLTDQLESLLSAQQPTSATQ
jgi:hypothetical protein